MKQFVLKDGELDGIYPGIGTVEIGKPITAYSDEHAETIKADGRFKQYRAPVEPDADKPSEGKPAEAKPSKAVESGKDGK